MTNHDYSSSAVVMIMNSSAIEVNDQHDWTTERIPLFPCKCTDRYTLFGFSMLEINKYHAAAYSVLLVAIIVSLVGIFLKLASRYYMDNFVPPHEDPRYSGCIALLPEDKRACSSAVHLKNNNNKPVIVV